MRNTSVTSDEIDISFRVSSNEYMHGLQKLAFFAFALILIFFFTSLSFVESAD